MFPAINPFVTTKYLSFIISQQLSIISDIFVPILTFKTLLVSIELPDNVSSFSVIGFLRFKTL